MTPNEIVASARLYGILDTTYVTAAQWTPMAQALAAGGVDLVEVRAKGSSTAETRSLLESVLPIFVGAKIPVILNDELEIALAYPGVGLHIGQDDIAVEVARERLGPDRILGLSTHSPTQAEAAAGRTELTYFCVGPVYATPTKPEYAEVGLKLVAWTKAQSFAKPWFAIGGVNESTLADVLSAGAQRVVVVSAILQAEDPAEKVKTLQRRLDAAHS